MPSSSSAPARRCAASRPIWAASSATSPEKVRDEPDLGAICARELMLAGRVHAQNRNLRRVRGLPADADLRVFSLHAPEVECIGKGKAHRPYEFGVKVSVATTLNRSKGGQFVTHIQALPGKPYDGHTLVTVIPAIEAQLGVTLKRVIADAGYKGHNAPPTHRFRIYTAGQKRGMTAAIRREMRRRSAIEPLIGHLKDDHGMGRNQLAHTIGDAANAVLAAVGYNFRRILAWLRLLLALFWAAIETTNQPSYVSQTN
jgi:IS5 family transposase